MDRKVLIIGGGFAGLATGSYLARSGLDTLILEQHTLPGGLCTSWKRQGYTMDYCVHWLVGTDPDSEFRQMWEELGAFDNADGSRTAFVNPEAFTHIGLSNGDALSLYSDIARLEDELHRIGPEDRAAIRRFCGDLRRLARFNDPVLAERHGLPGRLANTLRNAIPTITLIRHATTTIDGFAKRLRSPLLAEAFRAGIPADWSLVSLSLGLAMQHTKRAGYPIGGSLPLSRNMERRYRSLGGEIRYSARVESILVEGDRAVGVRLSSGEELRGGCVVSAADGHQTLYNMLPGVDLPERLKTAYSEYPLFPSSLFVALGIRADLDHLPHSSVPHLDEPLVLPDGDTHHRLSATVYHFDPTLAPPGRTMVTALINTWKGQYWIDLRRNDPAEYARQKAGIGEYVLTALERRFGGIRQAVEVLDVSTPATVDRYTGNWKGSYEGFAPTPKTLTKPLPRTLPGLGGFRMAGQWTTPGGGLPTAALDGRNAARAICREFRLPFRGV